MTALQVYRDDGPLAAWVAGRRTGSPLAHPLAWLVPPLVRIAEYGGLIALTALSDPDALPFCFAFLGVLAFHHYDTVYRLRLFALGPPAWVRWAGGGWDGRLVVAALLALAGVLGPGLLVASVGLGLVYVGEAAWSWRGLADAQSAAALEDDAEVVE
ncbi:MAG: DUF5941 domain-containing protein [Gaiellaceae bacterium]